MPISIVCPSCSVPLDILEKLQGKKVRCPECHHVFLFTEPAETPPPVPLKARAHTEERTAALSEPAGRAPTGLRGNGEEPRSWGVREEGRSSERSSGAWVLPLVVIGVIGLLVLLGGGVIISLIVFRDDYYDEDYGPMSRTATARAAPAPAGPWNGVEEGPTMLQFFGGELPPLPQPVAIRPPELDKDRVEVRIDGRIDDVAVGGGGRYLVLFLPEGRRLEVFDVNEAKVVRTIQIKGGNIRLATGMEWLVVADGASLHRYSLRSGQLERTAQLPDVGRLQTMAMGPASSGPLLLGLANRPIAGVPAAPGPGMRGMPFTGDLALIDVRTLGQLHLQGQLPPTPWDRVVVRASPDGRMFTATLADRVNPQRYPAQQTLVLIGNELRQFSNNSLWPDGSQVPGSSDQLVFGGRELCANRMLPLSWRSLDGNDWRVPALGGPYCLSLSPMLGEDRPLAVHHIGLLKPLATFRGLTAGMGDPWPGPAGLTYDKRLHFIPDAQLIITIPASDDRLILQRFDAEEARRKVEGPALFVASEPPLAARRGERFTYQLDVQPNPDKIQYRLESGPAGMRLLPTGLLTWQVPSALSTTESSVVVSVKAADGQELFHAFFIHHPGEVLVQNFAPPNAPAAPQRPLSLRAPALEADTAERPLAGLVTDVAVGGGGCYLVLHLANERKKQLAIFDVNEAKVIGEIPLPEGIIYFAAGMHKLIVMVPGHLVQRWDLATVKREAVHVLPISGSVRGIAMGPASDGPLLVASSRAAQVPRDRFDFFEVPTMKRLSIPMMDEVAPNSFAEHCVISASADGRAFGVWSAEVNPRWMAALVRTDDGLRVLRPAQDCLYLAPGSDGSVFYTGVGRFTQELAPLGQQVDGGPLVVPARQGDYYLSVPTEKDSRQPLKGATISVHRADRDGQRLSQIPGLDLGMFRTADERGRLSFDRRLHYLPAANLLIAIPSTNDRLILHRVAGNAAPGE